MKNQVLSLIFKCLISFTTVSSQWLNRGLHEVPAEALGWLSIPPNGVNVTGNVFEWFDEMEEKLLNDTSGLQKHNRFGFSISLPLMNKYGCWCYRGSEYPAGKGTGLFLEKFHFGEKIFLILVISGHFRSFQVIIGQFTQFLGHSR